MPVLAGQPIFTVAGASYVWEDLVLAGCLWGDWPALETRVRNGLACLASNLARRLAARAAIHARPAGEPAAGGDPPGSEGLQVSEDLLDRAPSASSSACSTPPWR